MRALHTIILLLLFSLTGAISSQAAMPVSRSELSNHCVTDIEQDSCGFIWIGTSNGLCKSFGSEYKIYFADADDPTTIPTNQIRDLYTDRTGRLWVLTTGGICSLDPDKKSFRRYTIAGQPDEEVSGLGLIEFADRLLSYGDKGLYEIDVDNATLKHVVGINGPATRKAVIGPGGRLWLTNGNTLMSVDKNLKPTSHLTFNNENLIVAMACDSSRIFLGTPSGVKILNPKNLAVTPTNLGSDYEVNNLLPLPDGHLIVSTGNRGVIVYDPATGKIGKTYRSIDFGELETEEINKVFVDRDNNFWVATFDKGIAQFTDRAGMFNVNHALTQAFRNEFVTRVIVDKNDNLWVGTRYNGIAFYDRKHKTKRDLNSHTVPGLSAFVNDFVQSMKLDDQGCLWVGYNNSLIVCDTDENGGISIIKKFPFYTSVVCMAQDSKGRMWVSTDNRGLGVIDENFDIIHNVGTPTIHSNNITKVIPFDKDHMLFSAFSDNLYLIDINSLTVKELPRNSDNNFKLDSAIDLYLDRDNNLWIGTYNNGLLRRDAKTGQISNCLGLQSDDLVALCQDRKGDIWASSSYGIYRFDNQGNLSSTYLTRDGLGGNQFHEKSVAESPGGQIYFGGNAGIEVISPSNYKDISRRIPLYLTGMTIMPGNRPALTGDMADRAEQSVSELTLDHADNSINFEFFGINYDAGSYLEYAYMLKGQDKDYIDLNTYNRATYSNLSAGDYEFWVKTRYKDGEWQDPVKLLSLTVKPSPWATPWAIAGYIIIFFILILLINRAYLRYRLVKQKYVLSNERMEQEKRIAANKLNFFTNISHELRTPLTLICGPAKHLKQNYEKMSPEQVGDSLEFIDSNIERLMTLINQLLNFRRVNNETLPLKVAESNLGKQLDALASLYNIYAGEKGINIHLARPDLKYLNLTYDSDKIEKIVSNLIVNAIKFSPDNADIQLKLELTDCPPEISPSDSNLYACISVTDHGSGIADKDIPKIFQPFKRLLGLSEKKAEGFGIGLNFVVHLVKEHKGIIRTSKNPEGGMTFTVILPVSPDAFQQSEYRHGVTDFPLASEVDINPVRTDEPAAPVAGQSVSDHASDEYHIDSNSDPDDDAEFSDIDENESELPKMLIVEDNVALNTFLQNLFNDKYNVIQAYNGDDGLRKAFDEYPDIIISDILMPGEIDGFELCRRVKNNNPTSHIPVILMTAKALDENKIEGYNCGADAYICKPFNPDVLSALVSNLIQRLERQKSYILSTAGSSAENAEGDQQVPAEELAPLDKKFLEKLYSYIDKSLDNCELNVNLLGKELGFSRTNFYRKVKALTGISPNDLLRVYRLNRAAELLLTREYTIGEVGERTGFGNQSHFSSLFKKHFGVSPRTYVANRFSSSNQE